MGTCVFERAWDWEKVQGGVQGEKVKRGGGETDLVHLQRATVHRPVFGSDSCPVYVEAYIPREINLFFNAIFLADVYAKVTCNRATRR